MRLKGHFDKGVNANQTSFTVFLDETDTFGSWHVALAQALVNKRVFDDANVSYTRKWYDEQEKIMVEEQVTVRVRFDMNITLRQGKSDPQLCATFWAYTGISLKNIEEIAEAAQLYVNEILSEAVKLDRMQSALQLLNKD